MNHKNRIFTLLSLLLLAMFVFVPTASAYDGRTSDTVTIGADEVVNDDLYLTGSTIVMDGTVNGNLIATGENVTVNGKVTGMVMAAGQSVTINGEVGKSVFAAGAAVTIGDNARISDDVFAAGAGVETKAGSQINGSLVMAGAQGLVSSEIGKDLVAGAGSLRIENTIGRDAQIAVGSADSTGPNYYGPNMPAMPSIPAGLTFGPDAKVNGTLEYTSDKSVSINSSVASDVKFVLPPQDNQIAAEVAQQNTQSNALFDAIRRIVALLLVGTLLAWLAPRWITAPAETIKARLLPSLGFGLIGVAAAGPIALIAFGVVIVLAIIFGLLSLGALSGLIVMTGLPTLTLAVVAFIAVLSYLCQAVVGYLVGQWVLNRTRPEWNSSIFAPVLTGLLILGLLFAVPVAGGLLQFLIVLASLGAIILTVYNRKPAAAAPLEAAPVIAG